MKELQDKVVFITGAGAGLGRALTLQFAAAGARLAISDYNEELLDECYELLQEQGTQTHKYCVDVSDEARVFAVAEEVVRDFKQVDIVINNAGIGPNVTKLIDMEIGAIKRMIDICLWGVIYPTKAFLPHLLTRPEASIVNISSLNGLIGYGGVSHYCAAKFGVRGFTETLWLEFADTNVTATLVHPGYIKTGIMARSSDFPTAEARQEAQAKLEKMPGGVSADKAAELIVEAVRKKQRRLLIGLDARIMSLFPRIFFNSYTLIVRKFARLSGFEI